MKWIITTMKNTSIIKTYSEVIKIPTFLERFRYLKIDNHVGEDIWGSHRLLNQEFYRSNEWRDFRTEIIVRDNCCDLAMDGYTIDKYVYIHHINPITEEDIINRNFSVLFNPENVITMSRNTHDAIHFGDEKRIFTGLLIRMPGDTKGW